MGFSKKRFRKIKQMKRQTRKRPKKGGGKKRRKRRSFRNKKYLNLRMKTLKNIIKLGRGGGPPGRNWAQAGGEPWGEHQLTTKQIASLKKINVLFLQKIWIVAQATAIKERHGTVLVDSRAAKRVWQRLKKAASARGMAADAAAATAKAVATARTAAGGESGGSGGSGGAGEISHRKENGKVIRQKT